MLRKLLLVFFLHVLGHQQRAAAEPAPESNDLIAESEKGGHFDKKSCNGCFDYAKIFDGAQIGKVHHTKDACRCQEKCQQTSGCTFFRFRFQYDETDEHNGRNKCFLLSKKTGENGRNNWISG